MELEEANLAVGLGENRPAVESIARQTPSSAGYSERIGRPLVKSQDMAPSSPPRRGVGEGKQHPDEEADGVSGRVRRELAQRMPQVYSM
jgi:hypothetical protein